MRIVVNTQIFYKEIEKYIWTDKTDLIKVNKNVMIDDKSKNQNKLNITSSKKKATQTIFLDHNRFQPIKSFLYTSDGHTFFQIETPLDIIYLPDRGGEYEVLPDRGGEVLPDEGGEYKVLPSTNNNIPCVIICLIYNFSIQFVKYDTLTYKFSYIKRLSMYSDLQKSKYLVIDDMYLVFIVEYDVHLYSTLVINLNDLIILIDSNERFRLPCTYNDITLSSNSTIDKVESNIFNNELIKLLNPLCKNIINIITEYLQPVLIDPEYYISY